MPLGWAVSFSPPVLRGSKTAEQTSPRHHRFPALAFQEGPVSTTAAAVSATRAHERFSHFLQFWPKHDFFLFSWCHPATSTVKRVWVIDYSLSELKVVKLDINVVLNALTQTRSSVARGLIGDDTRWDCVAQGAGNRMKSLQFMDAISKSNLILQTSCPCSRYSANLLRSTHTTDLGWEHSVFHNLRTEALLLPRLQPNFDNCQD